MKLLLDFFPILLFFAAFKVWGIYAATAVAIVATVAQIAFLRLRHGKVEPMQWLSLGVIVLFGGATLLAQSETFIKWKPTVLYWLFSLVLLVSATLGRNLIRQMLEDKMVLPDSIWHQLNRVWALFFAVMGAVNLFVAYQFSEPIWVNFKLFGLTACMLVFVLAQGAWLSRHLPEEE